MPKRKASGSKGRPASRRKATGTNNKLQLKRKASSNTVTLAPTSAKRKKMASVSYVVGNSYREIPRNRADLDRTGVHRKIHDWTLYLDVYGNPDIIERVHFDLGPSFSPSTFTCTSPIHIIKSDGQSSWRFKTRQQTYGSIQASVRIRGAGGTLKTLKHNTLLSEDSENLKAPIKKFTEAKLVRPLKVQKLDDTQKFGIELELTSSNVVTEEMIKHIITRGKNNNDTSVEIIPAYAQCHETSSNWKIVPDSSIMCSTTAPNCNKFELVSPILTGGTGLGKINKILKQLSTVEHQLKVNKSMGFHLHIDVSGFKYSQLIKICQNFIKYEDVIDALMPPSRRSGSSESNQFFRSNRQSLVDQISHNNNDKITNRMCHDTLKKRTRGNIRLLVKFMNNNGRYYKLNMQNLVTGRQPTIEFRQHSATINYEKVSSWVRFCVAFCNNSAKLAQPTPFNENRSLDYKFEALFQYVIKDRALRDYYQQRRESLASEVAAPCCNECGGGSCGGHHNVFQL